MLTFALKNRVDHHHRTHSDSMSRFQSWYTYQNTSSAVRTPISRRADSDKYVVMEEPR